MFVSGGYFVLKDRLRVFDGKDYISSVSRFVSVEGVDEYVIATLRTSETHNSIHCVEKVFGKCILPTKVTVEPDVYYKYFIRLGDLRYSIAGDTLNFNVPALYLSTPVAIDPSSLDQKCKTVIPNMNCKSTFNKLMGDLSDILERKGNKQKASVYDKAAKSLADNFHQFIKNNGNEIGYKNIAVTFIDEGSKSQHLFRYNESYCGEEKCSAEIDLGDNRLLIIK